MNKKIKFGLIGGVIGVIITLIVLSVVTLSTQTTAMEGTIKTQLNNQPAKLTKAMSANQQTIQFLQKNHISTVHLTTDNQGYKSSLYYVAKVNGHYMGIDLQSTPSKTFWGSTQYLVTGVKLIQK